MKIRLILAFVFIVVLIGCSSEDLTPKRDRTIHIKGFVLGYDGKPLTMAHVHAQITGKNIIKQSFQVGSSGEFSFPVKSADIINLEFTGVNHKMYTLEIFNVGCNEDIELEVKLKPNHLKDGLTELKLIGNFNKYSFSNGFILMKKEEDGTFSAFVPNRADTLFYQVLGAMDEERSINGTQYDGLVYDGGGDYRSFIVSKDSMVKITFDLNKMNFPDKDAKVSSNNKSMMRYFEIKKGISDLNLTAIDEFRKDENLEKYYNTMHKYLFNLWKNEDNARNKLFIAKNYNFYAFRAKNASQELIKYFYENIGNKSNLWKSQYMYLTPGITVIKDDEFRNELIKALTEEHPDKDVRAGILYELIGLYQSKDNKKESMKYYSVLIKKYPDSWGAKMAKKEYSPDRKIVVGKIVPDFSVENLDKPGSMISSKDLRGKFVMIDMWATWCGPCVGEMEHLHNAWTKFKNKNFTMLSISIDNKKEDIAKFRAGKWKMPWMHSFSEGVWKSKMVEFFEVTGVPKPMLIAPDGKILEMEGTLRGNDLEKTLSKYLH